MRWDGYRWCGEEVRRATRHLSKPHDIILLLPLRHTRLRLGLLNMEPAHVRPCSCNNQGVRSCAGVRDGPATVGRTRRTRTHALRVVPFVILASETQADVRFLTEEGGGKRTHLFAVQPMLNEQHLVERIAKQVAGLHEIFSRAPALSPRPREVPLLSHIRARDWSRVE